MAAESYDYYLRLLTLPRSASEQDIRAALAKELLVWTRRLAAPTLEARHEAERMLRRLDEAEAALLRAVRAPDSRVVGVYFGDTRAAIAVVDDQGRVVIIPNREGDEFTPAIIFFDGEIPVVGVEASRMAVIEPLQTVQYIRREMGNPSYRFNVSGKDFFPEDLSAMVLRKLKLDAEASLGRPVERAVVTVPASFNRAQRMAIHDAGRIAGLNVVGTIAEPVAAVLASGLESSGAQTLLVYDFGGGTFDVTIMKVENHEFTILATDGDARLGGKDIDVRLVNWFAEEVQRERGIDLRLDPRTRQDLLDKAEVAKKDLSSRESVSPVLMVGDKPLRVDLDRASFNEMIQDLIQKTRECVERAMKAASMTWSNIDTILLAGGSSRIPAVKAMIKEVCGREPRLGPDPASVVVLGAAIQAWIFPWSGLVDGAWRSPAWVECNSHSMGVVEHDERGRECNRIVLRKGTPYGTVAEKLLTTIENGQRSIRLTVTEGEEEDVSHVKVVGCKEMPIPPYPKGAPIKISFSYTPDGLVRVEAFDLTTNRSLGELKIQRVSNKTAEQVEESLRHIAKVKVE